MGLYIVTIGIIFGLLVSLILVDRLYRRFAARNPGLGPYRKEGCGDCSCHGGQCGTPAQD